MASFGEGLTSGIGQGMAWGKLIADTYSESKQKRELEEAGKLGQETIKSYDPETQASIQALRDQKDAEGNNLYTFEDVKGGGVRYKAAGDTDWVNIDQNKSRFKLGSKVQDTEFTADQIARARSDAMADVYARNGDPAKAYGLKALAREDRKGNQWEDINQNQINDLQALAEGKYDQLKGTIDKGVARYNDAQTGPYADGHRISIDWNKNEAIVTGPKNEVVKTIPINQQTAAQFIRSYYDDLRSAANPEFGLKSREVNAKEKSAQADVDYKGAGGVAERVGMANVQVHRAAIGAMNPLQAYQLQQAQQFDKGKAEVLTALERGDITEQQAAKKIGILGMKFGQSGTGLNKSEEAQVEYNPDTGETKYKGTVSAVEAAKAKNPALKAAMGDPKMEQPAKNQTGVDVKQDAQQATPARPDLSKWTMKPAGKTIWGEQDYVLEGPSGRMSLSDFKEKYKYDPRAEFVGRR